MLPILEATGPWLRIHLNEREPLYFGRTGRNRFDAPEGEYGILYAAADAHGAFVETFGWRTGVRVIDLLDLEARGLAQITTTRPLRLADLTASGLARLGADARLSTGDDHALSQRWALALWRHPAQPDGLHYRSRHDPSRYCVAVYDHAAGALAAVRLGSLAAQEHAALLADVLDTYQFGLAADRVLEGGSLQA